MRLLINGNYVANYDQVHQEVENDTYNSIGQAILSQVEHAVHNSEWYNYHSKWEHVQNFGQVKDICGNNLACYQDYIDYDGMKHTEITADIYKFICERVQVIKGGFEHNFLPKNINWDAMPSIDLGALKTYFIDPIWNHGGIDWHFILDCISWFI